MNIRRPRRVRRGSVYLAVLGAASMVAILGLAAIVAARLQVRVAEAQSETVKARFAAQSMLEIVLLRLAAAANWRSTHSNDTWSAPETVGAISFKYKLVDEIDGNLTNDAAQPVRLHVWAQTGATIRIHSVNLTPPPGTANLLLNGDMERAGAVPAPWSAYPDGTLDWPTGGAYAGSVQARVTARSSSSSGLMQKIDQPLQSGATYGLQAYVKSGLLTSGRISLVVTSTASGTETFNVTGALLLNAWTLISGSVTPTWKGTLTNAYIHINTTAGSSELRIDNASVMLTGNGTMLPQAGSWRRETLP